MTSPDPTKSRSENDQNVGKGKVTVRVRKRWWMGEVVKEFPNWEAAKRWLQGQ